MKLQAPSKFSLSNKQINFDGNALWPSVHHLWMWTSLFVIILCYKAISLILTVWCSLFQIAADVGDLATALKANSLMNLDSSDRCTSLVKLTPGNEDLYIAHNTFSSFSSMLRVLKRYTFGFHLTPGRFLQLPQQFVVPLFESRQMHLCAVYCAI